MKYRFLSLACVVGMSAVLFTGCTANNNGVGTRGIGRANTGLGVHPNATTMDGRGGSVYRNLTAADGVNRTGTTGMTGGTTGMTGFGTGGTGTTGTFGLSDHRQLGILNSEVLLLGNVMIVGSDTNTRTAGRAGNVTRTRSMLTTGTQSAGNNGRVTSGQTGVGATGSVGIGGYGATGTVGAGRTGTGGFGVSGGLGVGRTGTRGLNATGNLGAGGMGTSGVGGMGATGFDTMGTASATGDTAQMLQTQFGQSFRVMRVSDRRAIDAIHRVKRNLSSGTSLSMNSRAVLKDLQYILNNASDVNTANRAAGGRGTAAGAASR
ncbi:hypothetical protein E5161_01185 [Cohnella pontilimi]|uniref:Uncharacterized protein n=1 Tax=Cohnella pontilimi TaxID=2564100 RepID=A0A4U0FGJ3_9BACL|nr:hypothetical protein [Cohnella pontilimi]TJY44041.1 hypothetical protein E5161_01185 [Cohnella pontilimi]